MPLDSSRTSRRRRPSSSSTSPGSCWPAPAVRAALRRMGPRRTAPCTCVHDRLAVTRRRPACRAMLRVHLACAWWRATMCQSNARPSPQCCLTIPTARSARMRGPARRGSAPVLPTTCEGKVHDIDRRIGAHTRASLAGGREAAHRRARCGRKCAPDGHSAFTRRLQTHHSAWLSVDGLPRRFSSDAGRPQRHYHPRVAVRAVTTHDLCRRRQRGRVSRRRG
mmetsp:Transcript_8800/g.22772  ORF Transcript_8800/g.22772 Transcript_8800/m.22772 type:complete len:222 (+) Transcript_8800:145-810(+)